MRSPKPELDYKDIEEKAKLATFQKTAQKFKWELDELSYSLSALCKMICEKNNVSVGSGAFPGPDFWAVEGENKSLSEQAKELLETNVSSVVP